MANINFWNVLDCSPNLFISPDGHIVTHYGQLEWQWNCVRAALPIPTFDLSGAVSAYFEAEILARKRHWIDEIGFCTRQFPWQGKWLGSWANSIGIRHKGGIWVDGVRHEFANVSEHFIVGDIVGIGLVNATANLPIKCFATCNGQLLGSIDLPANFEALQLFPACSLHHGDDAISANFGQEVFKFDKFHLVEH